MNIKVTAFTVSEKSSNTKLDSLIGQAKINPRVLSLVTIIKVDETLISYSPCTIIQSRKTRWRPCLVVSVSDYGPRRPVWIPRWALIILLSSLFSVLVLNYIVLVK